MPIVVLQYRFYIYGTKSLQKISPLYSIDWWRSCCWEDVSPGNCSTSRSSSKLLRHSPLFLFNYNKCCLCVILQTGQSWHWSRITNSGRCYCHALHSLGCIWRMQSSSISLHCKLLNHSASQRNITFCRVLQILTHEPSLQIFQVLCALTLPVGKLIVDYVLKNHEVNIFLFSPAFLWKIKPFRTDAVWDYAFRTMLRFSWRSTTACGCTLCLGLRWLLVWSWPGMVY